MRIRVEKEDGLLLNSEKLPKGTERHVEDSLGALWLGHGWATDLDAKPSAATADKPAGKPARG